MGFSPKTRGRCWVGTIHVTNMEKAGLEKKQYECPEYLAEYFIRLWEESGAKREAAIAVCVSSTGCYHCHIACYGNTTTLKKVSKILFDSHIEPQLGGKQALTAYICKEGDYAEKGEQVLYTKGLEVIQDRQGLRSDLEVIEELLEEGLTPEQIYAESFRYRRYEKMIKSHYLAKRIAEIPLIKTMWNEYHFGRSGSGKTYSYFKLCEIFSPEEVYLCNDYANSGSSGGGFDFYANNPAKIVLLDEFRGNIPYAQLLSMLDVYSRNQQHCRFQNTYNLWENVIICSIYPPEEVYRFMVDDTKKNIDSISQFFRRLNVIVYHYKNKEGEYKSFEMPACEYSCAEEMIKKAELYEAGIICSEKLSIVHQKKVDEVVSHVQKQIDTSDSTDSIQKKF